MGIVVRQSIKSVFVTIIGVVLGGLVTLLSSHYFPKAEYGFTQNLIGIVTSVSLFSLLGFTSALLIIGQKYPVGHPARGTFLTICAVVPLVFSFLIGGLFYIIKEPFLNLYQPEDAARMREFFILFPIFTIIFVVLAWIEGYLQALNKIAIQTFARELLFRIFYIALIFLYGFNVIDYKQFIWLFVFIYLLPISFLVFIASRAGGFAFQFVKGTFTFKEIKEIIRFSAYHMLTMVSMVLIFQLSILLLGPLSSDGLEAVAVFTVASFVVAVLRSPTRVMGVAATPTFSKVYIDGKIKELRSLFQRSSVNMQLFGIAAFALVYLNIDSIQEMMSLVQTGYGEIKGLILILMIGQLADMITGFNYELIGITKYFRFNFWLAFFILIFVFLLNYFLIKEMNVYGAAWATSLGLVIYNILKSFFLWKKFKMQPFTKTTLKITILALLSASIAWIIPEINNTFIDLVVRSLVFSIPFVYFVLKMKISPELNKVVENIIRNKKFY